MGDSQLRCRFGAMNIDDQTLWVVCPDVSPITTPDGVGLLDFKSDTYCDLAVLSAAVWMLIKWTPTGITVREIVDLLETAVPLHREILEVETCRSVADFARDGFVGKQPCSGSVTERMDARTPPIGDGVGDNVSITDLDEWVTSLGARTTGAENGSLLLDIKDGKCYSLNSVAACVWVTIERNSWGISFEGIVDVLEYHFTATREELEHATRDCLADLQLQALVVERHRGGGDSSLVYTSALPPSELLVLESRQKGGPFIQRIETFESLAARLFPEGVKSNIDWRAKKLKNFIDNAPAKVTENLGHVCNQLELPFSDRQARRLFKSAEGISMKEYARKRRLVLAAQQLQGTNDPIKVVAADAGYHTQHGFRKAFHDMFRLSPAEFRRFWQRGHVSA